MLESFTGFDAIVIGVIVISALMAFARGFMRELATLGSFIAAFAAAFFARATFRDRVADMLPEGAPPILPDMILMVTAFVVIYIIAAWFGRHLSKNIQGMDGIGMLDHFAGLIFGAARGAAAILFLVFLTGLVLEEDRIPSFMQEAATYPSFKSMADGISDWTVGFSATKDDTAALPIPAETGQ